MFVALPSVTDDSRHLRIHINGSGSNGLLGSVMPLNLRHRRLHRTNSPLSTLIALTYRLGQTQTQSGNSGRRRRFGLFAVRRS